VSSAAVSASGSTALVWGAELDLDGEMVGDAGLVLGREGGVGDRRGVVERGPQRL
jgi:hypothetical protein